MLVSRIVKVTTVYVILDLGIFFMCVGKEGKNEDLKSSTFSLNIEV